MSVCDVPVISSVCDAVGEGTASLIAAPFDWLAQVQPGFAPSSTFHPQGKSRLVDGSS